MQNVSSPDKSYKYLREYLQSSSGQPTVPFLGMTLTDLTFVADGNHWFVNGMISMRKVTIYMESICTFLQHQFVPYLFESIEPVQQLWEDFASENYNEDQLWELSVAIKPRGSDKESDSPINAKK